MNSNGKNQILYRKKCKSQAVCVSLTGTGYDRRTLKHGGREGLECSCEL